MKILYGGRGYHGGGFGSFFILQGALLILLGVLVIMFPALLRVMVASFFILIGVIVLGFGFTIRQAERSVPEKGEQFFDV
ncbi:MAG: hypothetical protein R3231_10710 [bacterium]|nr:hypothetical protein [bacterium]